MGFDLYALPSTSESLNSSHPNDQPISGSGLSKAALRLDTLPRDTSAYCVSVSRHLCVHGRAYVSCIFILLHAHIYIYTCVCANLFVSLFIYLSLSLSLHHHPFLYMRSFIHSCIYYHYYYQHLFLLYIIITITIIAVIDRYEIIQV